MKYHDIMCQADGWSHLVDGVHREDFPSSFMAIAAARRLAERDQSEGVGAVIRFQTADGMLHPLASVSGLRLVAIDRQAG